MKNIELLNNLFEDAYEGAIFSTSGIFQYLKEHGVIERPNTLDLIGQVIQTKLFINQSLVISCADCDGRDSIIFKKIKRGEF